MSNPRFVVSKCVVVVRWCAREAKSVEYEVVDINESGLRVLDFDGDKKLALGNIFF